MLALGQVNIPQYSPDAQLVRGYYPWGMKCWPTTITTSPLLFEEGSYGKNNQGFLSFSSIYPKF